MRPRDRDASFLKGLSHDFENIAREFRKLVEEQHPIVRHAHFAGPGHGPPADEAGIANALALLDEARRAAKSGKDHQ